MAKENSKPKRRRRRLNPLRRWRKATNFYPNGDEDGAIGPITPIAPIQFQPIVPRYDLSTNEMREAGVGPAFDAAPDFADVEAEISPSDVEPKESRIEEEHRKGRPTPGTGKQLDLDA